MHQSALLLIEFQNEWLSEKGLLNHLFLDKEQLTTSLNNAQKIIHAAREISLHIIHSGLSYAKTYRELGAAKHGLRAAIPKHGTFLADSFASQFAQPFQPGKGELTVQGRIGASAFMGSNLDAYLRNNRIHTLYLMGYALHVCVESTFRAAHDLGYDPLLLKMPVLHLRKRKKSIF